MPADGFPDLAERLREMNARDPDPAEPPEFSDDAIALLFSATHGADLVFVAQSQKWLRWDGARYTEDTTLHIFDLARVVCRQQAALANAEAGREGAAWVSKIASAQKVSVSVAGRRWAMSTATGRREKALSPRSSVATL